MSLLCLYICVCSSLVIASSIPCDDGELVDTKFKQQRSIYCQKSFDGITYVPHGKYLILDEFGNVMVNGNFDRGKADGYWVKYYKSGTKAEEGQYKEDKKVGKWKFYDENGNLINENIFDKLSRPTDR